ncbi:MAG: hypothetical protein Aurels2KO_39510 [Aureliella sp.]
MKNNLLTILLGITFCVMPVVAKGHVFGVIAIEQRLPLSENSARGELWNDFHDLLREMSGDFARYFESRIGESLESVLSKSKVVLVVGYRDSEPIHGVMIGKDVLQTTKPEKPFLSRQVLNDFEVFSDVTFSSQEREGILSLLDNSNKVDANQVKSTIRFAIDLGSANVILSKYDPNFLLKKTGLDTGVSAGAFSIKGTEYRSVVELRSTGLNDVPWTALNKSPRVIDTLPFESSITVGADLLRLFGNTAATNVIGVGVASYPKVEDWFTKYENGEKKTVSLRDQLLPKLGPQLTKYTFKADPWKVLVVLPFRGRGTVDDLADLLNDYMRSEWNMYWREQPGAPAGFKRTWVIGENWRIAIAETFAVFSSDERLFETAFNSQDTKNSITMEKAPDERFIEILLSESGIQTLYKSFKYREGKGDSLISGTLSGAPLLKLFSNCCYGVLGTRRHSYKFGTLPSKEDLSAVVRSLRIVGVKDPADQITLKMFATVAE